MCTGVEIAMLAGTAISAGASYQKGREASAMAGFQADQARADAEAQKGAAAVYAEKIRKAGAVEQGKMQAAIAASGASSASQSAQELQQSTTSAYEQDALVAMYGGEANARRNLAQAQAYDIAGSRASRYAVAEAAATGLSGWYRASGYKSAGAAPITQATPSRATAGGGDWSMPAGSDWGY